MSWCIYAIFLKIKNLKNLRCKLIFIKYFISCFEFLGEKLNKVEHINKNLCIQSIYNILSINIFY
jgi:hypothetical protein